MTKQKPIIVNYHTHNPTQQAVPDRGQHLARSHIQAIETFLADRMGYQAADDWPNDPPAPGPTMGATVPTDADWPVLQALVGTMGCRRLFETGAPTFAKVGPSIAAGLDVWHSWKLPPGEVAAGEHDDVILDYLVAVEAALAPGQAFRTTIWHEPEDDIKDGRFTLDDWWDATNLLMGLADSVAHGGEDLAAGIVLMSWTFDPASGRNPGDYHVPGVAHYGIDCYQTRGSTKTWADRAGQFTGMVKSWGTLSLTEYGCPEGTPIDGGKPGWLADAYAWAVSNGVPFMAYFDNAGGVISDGPDYLLDSSASTTEEFRRQVAG